MIWRAQNSFSGGIISRKMAGRVDLGQYAASLSALWNFKVLPHGGIQNRSGTRYCAAAKYPDKKCRMIPFEFSQTESYGMEVGESYIRFFFHGELVEDAGVPVEVVTTYSEAELPDVDYVQTGNIMFLFHPDHKPKKLTRKDDLGKVWEFEDMKFVDGPYDTINTDDSLTLTSLVDSGATHLTASKDLFVVTDVGRHVRIFNDASGAEAWGWARITVFTNSKEVDAAIISGTFPTTATSKWKLGKYSRTTGYPSTGTFYERRLCLGGMKDFPQDIDMSRTDFPEEFFTAPDLQLIAEDAVGISLYSEHIDEIQWLRQTRSGLAVGTSGGEWVITGAGGKDDPIRPDSVLARKSVVTPCHSTVKPRQLDNAILFLSKAGNRIHELSFDWKEDSFVALDLTLLSEDLFAGHTVTCLESTLVDRVLWVVLDDGVLIGLTYMKNESIVAWHQHFTVGKFESVAAVSEDTREVLYAVVNRTIGGVERRYIEYFEDDFNGVDIKEAFFVDCGITATSDPPTEIIFGLDHLEGEEVVALADGRTVAPMTVAGGQVRLPFPASKINVGLAIEASGLTLPVELESISNGATLGRMKDIASVIMLVTESYGCKVGRDINNLEEVVFNEEIIFGVHPELFSGSKKIDSIGGQPNREVRVAFSQDEPLPLTLNSMITELSILED